MHDFSFRNPWAVFEVETCIFFFFTFQETVGSYIKNIKNVVLYEKNHDCSFIIDVYIINK